MKHGKSYSPEYKVWDAMKQRCTNTNHKRWKDYGGRGIFVCDEWLSSFENFYTDMGDRPSADYELDRINNDDGYYKDNCRWVDRITNLKNKRTHHNCIKLSINGREYTIRELSEEYGIKYDTIKRRYYRGKRGIDLIK